MSSSSRSGGARHENTFLFRCSSLPWKILRPLTTPMGTSRVTSAYRKSLRLHKRRFAQPGQVVARYRGAEFVVLLLGTGAEDAKPMADHLHKTIEALDLGPTVAVGVATAYPKEGTSRGALLTSAKNAVPNRK